jgi:hypothetical protein
MPPKKKLSFKTVKGTKQRTPRCKSRDRTAAAPVTPGPHEAVADATNKDTPHGSDKTRARERSSSKHSRLGSNAKQYAQRKLALEPSDSFGSVATPVAQRPRTEPISPDAETATSVVPDATGSAAAATRWADFRRRTDELAETLETMSVEPAQTRKSAPREALRAQTMRTVELEIKTARRRAREQRELLLAVLESPTLAFRPEVLYLQLAMAQFAMHYPLEIHTGREMGSGFMAMAKRSRATALPRLRGVYELDVLRTVLRTDTHLRRRFEAALEYHQQAYSSALAGFGRMAQGEEQVKDGELFVELMVRLHESVRRWKGPGRPPNASDHASGPGKVSRRYSAAYRNSQEGFRSGLGTTFSSELVCGVTVWSVSRHAGSGTKPPPTACS